MALREKLRVLVVDDMSTSRGVIAQALDGMGIQHVALASDGASALQSMAASPVHLVVSDFNMPGMNGLELLNKIRSNAATQKVGFLLITGRATKEIVEAGRKLGMNNLIQKPFDAPTLRTAIEAVVGRL